MDIQSFLAMLLFAIFFIPAFVFICFSLGKNKVRNIIMYVMCILSVVVFAWLVNYNSNLNWMTYIIIPIGAVLMLYLSVECVIYKLKQPIEVANSIKEFKVTSLSKYSHNLVANRTFFVIPILFAAINVLLSIYVFDSSMKVVFGNIIAALILSLSVILVILTVLYITSKKSQLLMVSGILYIILSVLNVCVEFAGVNFNGSIYIFVAEGIVNISIGVMYILAYIYGRNCIDE